MNGWQRFAILLLCCFAVMVCYPDFDASGWTFIGILIAMWTGGILVLSIISNMFGIYRLETFKPILQISRIRGILHKCATRCGLSGRNAAPPAPLFPRLLRLLLHATGK